MKADAGSHAARPNLKPYWIAGGLIVIAAIGCVWYTNNEVSESLKAEAPLARPTYKTTAASTATSENSTSGMKKAGLENTHTPQIGRSSGDDGAPKASSPSENPDDLGE